MIASPADVTLDTPLTRSPEVMYQEIGGEAVLLDLASETYFGLNEVGTRFRELLPEAATLAAVHAALCAAFDAPANAVERDLLALATQLRAARFVKVVG